MGLGTIYTWSLFNQPLVSKYGWSLNAVAITFSITSLSLAFSTLFASKLQEKWGLRKLIMIAGLALGLGLILSSQASSLILLYVLGSCCRLCRWYSIYHFTIKFNKVVSRA